jgi:hypothetical protein
MRSIDSHCPKIALRPLAQPPCKKCAREKERPADTVLANAVDRPRDLEPCPSQTRYEGKAWCLIWCQARYWLRVKTVRFSKSADWIWEQPRHLWFTVERTWVFESSNWSVAWRNERSYSKWWEIRRMRFEKLHKTLRCEPATGRHINELVHHIIFRHALSQKTFCVSLNQRTISRKMWPIKGSDRRAWDTLTSLDNDFQSEGSPAKSSLFSWNDRLLHLDLEMICKVGENCT